jgi:hypothetical protein
LSKTTSLRPPVTLLERIRLAANKWDVPCQSLVKVWLAEKLEEEEGQEPARVPD